MNIYYVKVYSERFKETGRLLVTAETPEAATKEVEDHFGTKDWKAFKPVYVARKSEKDPEFFQELPSEA